MPDRGIGELVFSWNWADVDQSRVLSVTIGTTYFINALVEADARRLSRVAVVRLCGAFTRQIPPFSDFPAGLRRVLDGGAHYLDGGLEIDGREIAPLDHEQIRKAARDILASGVKSVTLVGVFAPLDHAGVHEETCKRILLQEAPELEATIDAARRKIKKMIESVVEKMKVSVAPVHILLVGGGALLVTEELDGVDKCIQPVHQGAANAVGAAIGKISGEVDVIEILEDRDEKEVVAAACQKAIDQAICKGAAAEDVSVVEINKIPLQYVDNGAMRIQTLSNQPSGHRSGIDLNSYRPEVRDGTCVINERIASGEEIPAGIDALLKILGKDKPDAIFTDEIGGGNGMSTFPTAAHYDIPVIDGDAMGRAYPTMYQATLSVYGHPLTPCTLSEARGNVNIVMNTDNPIRLERLLRTAAIELGLGCAVAARPLPGSAIKAHGVPNTLSQAWYIGRAVHLARRNKTSFTDAIFAQCAVKLLFTGKIVDVRRSVGDGYTMGSVLIAPLAEVEFESFLLNEYLYAALTDSAGSEENQEVICTVPDLISILGQDGEAIGSQDLRYGLRVSVIGLPAHPLWKTEKAMLVGGPAAFGLHMPFVRVGEYTAAKSVMEEYGVASILLSGP
ncbi:hypothetical protein ACHAQH_005820 [Verticillium albo-atrum]